MRTNLKAKPTERTHEGAPTFASSPIKELRRSLMACMLWENGFYESGEDHAARMARLVKECSFEDAAQAAVDAREKFKLRHAPLLVVRELLRHHTGRKVGDLIERVIQRPDEMGELLSLYWKDDANRPLTAQLKVGLARAFKKFNEYQLAKYNRDAAIKLRDVMFMTHVRPRDEEHAALLKRVAENTLAVPDTWETELSAGKDKKETFERLIGEKKLGALALLRNLRGMLEAGVSEDVIRAGLGSMKVERVLPFRFITAAKYAPQIEDALDAAMLRQLSQAPKLPGKTIIVVDVSGSMYHANVSEKSELTRAHAACAVAALARELCETSRIYATAGSDSTRIHQTQLVPSRRGMALIDAVYNLCRPLGGGGIFLKQVMDYLYEQEHEADRIIVVTDEQDCGILSGDRPDSARAFGRFNYIVNVATYQHGIAYNKFTHINGWSEAVLDYVREFEAEKA